MQEIKMSEMRDIQLEILEFLDKICRENDIEYSLCGGSLLGSVRHQGYIPWDDDIDLMLRRDHYNKLIDVLVKQKIEPNYVTWHYSQRPTFQAYTKIFDQRTILGKSLDHMWTGIGVHVDIFPYDILPTDDTERANFMKEMHQQNENLVSTSFPEYVSGSKWYYAAVRLFLRFPRYLKYHGKNQTFAAQLDQEYQKYLDTDEKQIGCLCSRYIGREYFPREVFDEYEDAPFEHLTARKIKDHDTLLKQVFGNYMKLPPEKDREIHDFYTWYWK